MLYEMVTGKLPFAGETPTETISSDSPERTGAAKSLCERVPSELERIVNKALTKDREERYQTAKDLLIDLRNLKRKLKLMPKSIVLFPLNCARPPHLSMASADRNGADAAATTATASAAPAVSSAEYVVTEIKRS